MDSDRSHTAQVSEPQGADPTPTGQQRAPRPQALNPGAHISRYVVLSKVGEGGMGAVYAAYDPQLDRKIALKLLHEGSQEEVQLRLTREAQAMARLNHPNVASVFDAGTHEGRVFIAMEFLEGATLGEHLAAHPRNLPQTLARYESAGRGLAAAHEAGLVHRDFKPDNVMFTLDGRVVVLDFGLARPENAPAPSPAAPAPTSALESPLTETGAIMGTPAYMAPEQHRGETVDARTDQFSFCVALYEALYAERPFEGDTVPRYMFNLLEGKLRPEPPKSNVPQWLRRALLRGLSIDREARFENMEALLEALIELPARKKRRRRLVGGASVALATVAGLALSISTTTRCADGDQKVSGLIAPARLARARAAFQSAGLSYGGAQWGTIEAELERFANRWTQTYEQSCLATRARGDQSEELLDRSMACLEDKRQQAQALLEVFERADKTVVQRSTSAINALGPLSTCTDRQYLLARVKPPTNPEPVRKIRDRLAQAEALLLSGKYQEGLALSKAIQQRAAQVDYPPVRAEVLAQIGRLHERNGQYREATQKQSEAYFLALQSGHEELAARTATSLAFLTGYRSTKIETGLTWGRHAKALLSRVGLPEVEGHLESTLGVVLRARGDFQTALEHGKRSIMLRRRALGEDHPHVAYSIANTGSIYNSLHRYEEAAAHFRQTLKILTAKLGPDHPDLAHALNNLGVSLMALGEYEQALEPVQRSIAIARATLGEAHPRLAITRSVLSYALMNLGSFERAIALNARSFEVLKGAYEESHPERASVLNNWGRALRLAGRPQEALQKHERAERESLKSLPPTHAAVTESRYLKAVALLLLKRPKEGLDAVELSLKGRERPDPDWIGPLTTKAQLLLTLGRPQAALEAVTQARRLLKGRKMEPDLHADAALTLGRALMALDREKPRAVSLVKEAQRRYAQRPSSTRWSAIP